MSASLAYIAAAVVALWGVAHVIPTRQVVAGFGPISADNRRVLTQEWIAEALTMWGLGAITIAATAIGGTGDIRAWVYRAITLVAIVLLTAVTGTRTPVVWFKICPAVMAVAAALLLTVSFV